MVRRPHLLGIDDGPFARGDRDAVIVAVAMEGHDLVEAVAVTRFPVDGDDATGFLGAWIVGLRVHPALHGIFLGGITIAGLGIIDVTALAARTGCPVLAVSRRDPRDHRVADALAAAGLADRRAILDRTPPAHALGAGLYVASAGATVAETTVLVRAASAKAAVPEPLRLAHLIAAAVASGQSHGRV
jgi:uncharacterized protein